MSRQSVKLTPKFLLDNKFKKISSWNPSDIEKEAKKITGDLYLTYRKDFVLKNYHFRDPDDAFDRISNETKPYREEAEAVERSKIGYLPI
jgi:hypothetical protein